MRAACVVSLAVLGALLVAPTDAEAGHRRCRTCCAGATSGGNWFHYTSGGGMYVPFARSTPVVTTVSHGAVSSSPYVPPPAYGPPVQYAAPYCHGCRPR